MKKILVITGPTATGKTDLALNLAKEFNGEIVSCDSRQVYIGLDIGTGKLLSLPVIPARRFEEASPFVGKAGIQLKNESRIKYEMTITKARKYWQINGIKIWMIDVISPRKQYTVYGYVKDATKVLEDILKRGKLPIVVGGTGLYLKALLEGLPNLEVPVDLVLRKQLEKLSKEKLQKKLQELSVARWISLNESDRENPRRLIRAIELEISPRISPYGYFRGGTSYNVLKIGLTASREVLYKKIDDRVLSRIDQGMIEEVKDLKDKGLSIKRMKQLGLEYGVLSDYLIGKIKEKSELINTLQSKIHQYAKRQITWFKKDSDIQWFDISAKDYVKKVEKIMRKWYYPIDAKKS